MKEVSIQILSREDSPKARSKLVLSQIWFLVRNGVFDIPEVIDIYAQHIKEILSDARKTKSTRIVYEVERNIINVLGHIANSSPKIFQEKFQSIIFHHDNAMEFINWQLEQWYEDFFNGATKTLPVLQRAHLGHYLDTRLENITGRKEFFQYLKNLIFAWQKYPNIVSSYIDKQYWFFSVNVYMRNDSTQHDINYSKIWKWEQGEFIRRTNIMSFFTSKFNSLPESNNQAFGMDLWLSEDEKNLVNSLILLIDPNWMTWVHEVDRKKHDKNPFVISEEFPENRVYH